MTSVPRQSNAGRTIGYQVTHTYCRSCAPEGVRDYYPALIEGDDCGVPYRCDDCGEPLAPCEHEWGKWGAWFEGGEWRSCQKPGCQEIERR